MSRAWERGRLARIAGKAREANPYGRRRLQNVQWLSGWLHQDERQRDTLDALAESAAAREAAARTREERREREQLGIFSAYPIPPAKR